MFHDSTTRQELINPSDPQRDQPCNKKWDSFQPEPATADTEPGCCLVVDAVLLGAARAASLLPGTKAARGDPNEVVRKE